MKWQQQSERNGVLIAIMILLLVFQFINGQQSQEELLSQNRSPKALMRHKMIYGKKKFDDFCFERKRNVEYEKTKLVLEKQWREGSRNLTIFFGHIHHAGGTAVCSHARKLMACNPSNNCHHPNEFSRLHPPPTQGSREEQLKFQRKVPWRFYSVEKKMPKELILHGPFLYMIIFRHPYYLTISNYLRQRNLKSYEGTLSQYLTSSHHSLSLERYFNVYHGFLEFLAVAHRRNRSEMVRKALDRLDKFSVILLTDDMESSSEVLHHKLAWDLDGFNIHYSPNMTRADQIHRNSQGPQERLLRFLSKNLTVAEKKLFRRTLKSDLQIFRYARCSVQWQLRELSLPPLPDYEEKFGDLEGLF
jgi:hypothetical protein